MVAPSLAHRAARPPLSMTGVGWGKGNGKDRVVVERCERLG